MTATALAMACVATVCLALIHYRARSRRQTVAEALIDWLYAAAAIAYAVAQAADAAVVRYRRARAEIRAAHTPLYAEEAR